MTRESLTARARRRARARPTERRPLREVVGTPRWESGRGSVLGPDTDRRTSWWVLTLSCGHVVERFVKYTPDESRPKGDRYSRHRSPADILPAPRRARCDYCKPGEQQEANA